MSYSSEKYNGLEIAVIGMSGRFPGAGNVAALWDLLSAGRDGTSTFTRQQLRDAGVDESLLRDPNYVTVRGVVDDVSHFDNGFFGYSARESMLLDPQIRIFMECVWEALEDASCNPFTYTKKIGLFAGANPNLYWTIAAHLSGMEDIGDLANKDLLSTRISYKLNLKGPSHTIFTACSTSLVTIHQACRSLLGGECEMAIAGGVSIELPQTSGYLYKDGMILSRDGRNRSFDKNASGTVFSNGAGVVVLKPLEDAIRDRENIYAVIKGTAVNNDGNRKVSFSAPSVKGQAEVIKEALQIAEVNPETISYIEAHGSATPIGDPIEIEALTQAFNTTSKQFCGIGSIKSNLGHLNIASGVAGFIKAVMTVYKKEIPASIHVEETNSKIDFESSPFYVVAQNQSLKNKSAPIRAGISSFGIGGTNAHAIIEEAPERKIKTNDQRPALLLLSARTEDSLIAFKQKIIEFFENGDRSLHDVAYSLQTGRHSFTKRIAVTSHTAKDAIQDLKQNSKIATVDGNTEPTIVFMFPGQGSQYIKMGYDLYSKIESFRNDADNGLTLASRYLNVDLKALWLAKDENGMQAANINSTIYAQPLLFIFEYALCKYVQRLGIQPKAMIGHSLGEYVAACIGGVFSFEDALKLVVRRGQLMQSAKAGAMLSVSVSESDVQQLVTNDLSVAAVNGGSTCVVSGTIEAIGDLMTKLDGAGVQHRQLNTSHAFHSFMMDDILPAFEQAFLNVALNRPVIPFVSNRTATLANDDVISPRYWVEHARHAVRFYEGIKTLAQPNTVFIEIGPGNTLSAMAGKILKELGSFEAINLIRHQHEQVADEYYLLNKLGLLWCKGVAIRWKEHYHGEDRSKVSLPTYAFDRKHFWLDEATVTKRISLLKNGTDTGCQTPDNNEPFDSEIRVATNSQIENTAIHGDAETKIGKIWHDLFGTTTISNTENYFDLGGDSLLMVSAVARIEKDLEVKISINDFYANPTISALAKLITSRQRTPAVRIMPAEKNEYYPCTSAQKMMFYMQSLHPESTAYNITKVIELYPAIDEDRLESCFNKIVQTQENIRTIFKVVHGEPVQIVLDQYTVQFERIDGQKKKLTQDVADKFIRPFKLTESPAIRAGFLRCEEATYLIIDIHHIICDGVSIDILKNELNDLYFEGRRHTSRLQYKDFAVWQRRITEQGLLRKQEQFWLDKFRRPVPVLNLPIDFERPSMADLTGHHVVQSFSADLTSHVRKLIKDTDSTLFNHLLTVAYIVLHQYTKNEDIAIGTGTKGRNFMDADTIFGNFVNTIALRAFPDSRKTYETFQREVKEMVGEGLENQDYQYEELINKLPYNKGRLNKSLFNVAITLVAPSMISQEEPSHRKMFKRYIDFFDQTSKFDLDINAVDEKEHITLVIEYASALFKESTIKFFIQKYIRVFEYVTANPWITIGDIAEQLEPACENDGTEKVLDKSTDFHKMITESFLNHKY